MFLDDMPGSVKFKNTTKYEDHIHLGYIVNKKEEDFAAHISNMFNFGKTEEEVKRPE
jgi:hypothetical protein